MALGYIVEFCELNLDTPAIVILSRSLMLDDNPEHFSHIIMPCADRQKYSLLLKKIIKTQFLDTCIKCL